MDVQHSAKSAWKPHSLFHISQIRNQIPGYSLPGGLRSELKKHGCPHTHIFCMEDPKNTVPP